MMHINKSKVLKYHKNRVEYPLETRLFINIQFGIGLLCLLVFLSESYFNHYAAAKFIWIAGVIVSLFFSELALREKNLKSLSSVVSVIYTIFVFIGIDYSGSILTPSILFTFLIILILSVINKSVINLLCILSINIYVIYRAFSEMGRGRDIVISSKVYIDWALYFTIIALIVFWITDRLMFLLLEYDTEIKNANHKLYMNSITDPLTGLYNRYYLNKVSNEIINDRRVENHLSAAIMVDIDYFKNYNDYYGHVAGDQCLMAVASALRRSLYRK